MNKDTYYSRVIIRCSASCIIFTLTAFTKLQNDNNKPLSYFRVFSGSTLKKQYEFV